MDAQRWTNRRRRQRVSIGGEGKRRMEKIVEVSGYISVVVKLEGKMLYVVKLALTLKLMAFPNKHYNNNVL